MEQALGWLIFGTGWPILIVGSIWAWRRASALRGATRSFLGIALASFYVLGYTCTVFWRGGSWLAGVLPAFLVFLVLFVATLRGVAASTGGGQSA
jgi:hypothetical protein